MLRSLPVATFMEEATSRRLMIFLEGKELSAVS
jgi:hypothetical protein